MINEQFFHCALASERVFYVTLLCAVVKVSRPVTGCTSLLPLGIMLNVQKKAHCVIWFIGSKSVVGVNLLFCRTYLGQTASDDKFILRLIN